MGQGMMRVLCQHLPSNTRDIPLRLCFCLARDGYSHHTMFRNLKGQDFSFLILKDTLGHIFGAYLTGAIRSRNKFCGDGDSFVFTFHDGEELDIF
jgi:hypothetical protein